MYHANFLVAIRGSASLVQHRRQHESWEKTIGIRFEASSRPACLTLTKAVLLKFKLYLLLRNRAGKETQGKKAHPLTDQRLFKLRSVGDPRNSVVSAPNTSIDFVNRLKTE